MVNSRELVLEVKRLKRKIIALQYMEEFSGSSHSNLQSKRQIAEEALKMIEDFLEKIKEEGLYLPEPNNFRERLKSLIRKKVWRISFKKNKKPKNKEGLNNKELFLEEVLALY